MSVEMSELAIVMDSEASMSERETRDETEMSSLPDIFMFVRLRAPLVWRAKTATSVKEVSMEMVKHWRSRVFPLIVKKDDVKEVSS